MPVPSLSSARSVRFGLNYVPSRRWYYSWNDWDASEIAEDMDAMASLGIDHLRVQLVWPYFQPNPDHVSPAHLRRLKELMALAEARGLDVLLCPLTGWLSGYAFLPPGISGRDVFLREDVFQQSTRYFDAVLHAVGAFRNFIGFDLGNEINVLAPGLPSAQGDAWGRRLVSWLRPRMRDRWIVNGVDHNPWFNGDAFSLRHLVEDYDAVTLHAWPLFTGCLLRDGLADAPSTQLAAFMTGLARHALGAVALDKPVWLQEFGASERWGTPAERERYMRRSVSLATRAGATWITWWCSHDIDPAFRFDPLEYSLGLFTTGNQAKPLAATYRELIAEFSHARIAPSAAFREEWTHFAPGVTERLADGLWQEQQRATTTWSLFEDYLVEATASLPVR